MMYDALIMIKAINTNDKLTGIFKSSYEEQKEKEYRVRSEKDIKLLRSAFEGDALQKEKILVVFVFSADMDGYKIDRIYLGRCIVIEAKSIAIHFEIKKCISSEMVIKNILSYSELDLKQDFEKDSYINIEYSEALILQLRELFCEQEKFSKKQKVEYCVRREEGYLHPYAQHNEHCQRAWASNAEESERSEFQRDRERIVNSKAFRRMVDKAQIFTSSKGDHYRTRMTHTLEVAQIARSVANSLGLNIDLTEAIALGHDLGHTPFGHQGERTLDDIINGRTDVLSLLEFEGKNPYGGFKHNFQSLRMLTKLEEKYVSHAGLDVSYQVLEGVLKHTSNHGKACGSCTKSKCKSGCCDYAEFVDEETRRHLYVEYESPTTLEGQVVAIADEIAQRSHDIDDAFSSGLLTFEEFEDYLKLSKLKPLSVMIEKTFDSVMGQEKRVLIDRQEMLTARVISDIISYLVNDVVRKSKENIGNYKENSFYLDKHRFDQKLISFSEEGNEVCSLLEKMISKRAINCLEVTRFDRNADKIVKYLFQAYYHNPKLIHSGTLRRMYIDMLEFTDNVIDFVKADPVLVKEEFKEIIDHKYPFDISEWSKEDEDYYKKRKILIRSIVDYIAGMTDSYAANEYNALR